MSLVCMPWNGRQAKIIKNRGKEYYFQCLSRFFNFSAFNADGTDIDFLFFTVKQNVYFLNVRAELPVCPPVGMAYIFPFHFCLAADCAYS